MPHQSLVTGAHELIIGLTKNAGPIERDVFLLEDEEARTPLEYAAKEHRLSGPDFWMDFLEYAIELAGRDHTKSLSHLRILPVGINRLAASREGVFLQPAKLAENIEDDVDGDEDSEKLPRLKEQR